MRMKAELLSVLVVLPEGWQRNVVFDPTEDRLVYRCGYALKHKGGKSRFLRVSPEILAAYAGMQLPCWECRKKVWSVNLSQVKKHKPMFGSAIVAGAVFSAALGARAGGRN